MQEFRNDKQVLLDAKYSIVKDDENMITSISSLAKETRKIMCKRKY